jgi:phosphoribosylaminoimidazole-succinocarboxamide synthase
VRDTYTLAGDRLALVTTDRLSAFDRVLASIPYKGQVLNQTSAWWMREAVAAGVLPATALLSVPDPNVSLMARCRVFPVEFVVRGYLTGSTDTSLWTHYARGEREYCGNAFPDGLVKNQRLAANVITPTTKAVDHDVPISPRDILAQGLMTPAEWEAASTAALALFAFGQETAARRGLLLVDTKYEFGVDPRTGSVVLVDEVHTPDSSRYWLADTYAARTAAGQEPQSIDKEFVRLWVRARCDPYAADAAIPQPPADLVAELARRYITLHERITGTDFVPAPLGGDANARMRAAVRAALDEMDG